MNKVVVSTLLSAALVATAPLALSQSSGNAPHARYAAAGSPHGERAFRMPSERVEARLAYLRTALKITDAQQSQWNAFADTLRKQAKDMDARVQARRAQRAEGKPDARPTAIERLAHRQQRLAHASARLDELLAAAKPLYAALTPEQQKVADELLAQRHRGMRHGHRHGHA
jgi:hypothetical protein